MSALGFIHNGNTFDIMRCYVAIGSSAEVHGMKKVENQKKFD